MSSPLFPPPPPPTLRMPRSPRGRAGPWLSFLIHLVIVLLVVEYARLGNIWDAAPVAGTPESLSGGGGSGRREVSMIALSAPAPPAAVKAPPPVVPVPPPPPPPTIVPAPAPPPITAPPADTVPHPTEGAATPGSGGGTGGGSGSGSGPGSGPGTGPGKGAPGTPVPADSAVASGRPPEPRQVILPPFDYPRSIHGQTFTVTFFVLENGRVDRVVFAPEVPDRGFAKKFGETMKSYAFRPARSPAGLPVPGVYTINFTF